MPRYRKKNISKKRSMAQKLRHQREKRQKIIIIALEHNYSRLEDTQGPSTRHSSSTFTELTYLNTKEELKIDVETVKEEKSIPNCPSNFVEMGTDGDIDSTVLHECSFISEEEYNKIKKENLEMVPPEEPYLKGHRIVDLHHILNWSMQMQKKHSGQCPFGQMRVVNERHIGLYSILTFKCDYCGISEDHSTENTGPEKSSLNYGAVWCTLSTGNTYNHLKDFLSALDIPCMSDKVFQDIKTELGDKFTNNLHTSMEEADKVKKEWDIHYPSIQNGKVDDKGVPYLTVYVDGR